MILLVEDNSDHELLTVRAMKKNGIAEGLVVVRDGAEALDFLFGTGDFESRDTSLQPNVVLLDLQLPKISGLEVLKRLRADIRTRLLPVVILTSSDEEHDLLEGYALGGNSYIRKPVEYEQFIEATRQLGMYWLDLNEAPPLYRGKGAL